ncbi:hypothetical protein Poli38472_004797 [Pythium oligandrum]|uniref:SET domain-containing protein n=1 Tax=Pythium oligandrum TaxID=41045 RepID=A0A8K1FIG5_PYTOL|nr:hypothetical protein Poli38472_004797 [Pythium oligandrum]|eukprot:TMW59728.1 hypothetical protein Poli38472_004797 [Pythium oligandrum]
MPQSNEPTVQQYFDELLKNELQTDAIVCGFAGEHKGKAIYADKAFKAGEAIWSERPFVAMQHEDNKDFADCCEHCFVSLIDSKEAWEHVEQANEGENDVAKFEDFEGAIDWLQKQGGKSDEESYFNVFRLAKNKVQCVCGVLYCSEKCKKAAYEQQHAIMCTRADDNSTPMGHYINHTLVTNEIFQLAGKVIARILLRFISTHDLGYARQPVAMFCQEPWWEVVTSEDDLEPGQTMEEYKDCFKGLLMQTLEHFMVGLRDNLERMEKNDELNRLSVDAVLGSCADVLTLDFFGNVVGMFEMNNISMEIDHPFHTLGEALLESSEDEKREIPAVLNKVRIALKNYAEKYQHSHERHEGEECSGDHAHDHSHDHAHDHHHHDHNHAEGETCAEIDECCDGCEEYFVGVEGTALFSTICTMNHSCDPNCTVIYTRDGEAQVFAVQDINKGDELCISYIDVDQDIKERQECLREYQFICQCARCEEERHA